jgi:hypothetical protein
VLVFTRIAPDCRVVGKLRVRGHAGLNRLRFRGRIGRRVLPPGTYRVTARTRSQAPVRVDVVIVGHANPSPAEIAVARATNACAPPDSRSETAAAGVSSTGVTPPSSSKSKKSAFTRARGTLGVQFTRAAEVVREVPPFLFVILGVAIVLLGLATIPRQMAPTLRLQALLAYNRHLVALAGTITLIGVAITWAVW